MCDIFVGRETKDRKERYDPMKQIVAHLLSLTLLLPLFPSALAAPGDATKPGESSTNTLSLDPTQIGPVAFAMQLCKYTVDTAVQTLNDTAAETTATPTVATPKLDNTDLSIVAYTVLLTMIPIVHEIVGL